MPRAVTSIIAGFRGNPGRGLTLAGLAVALAFTPAIFVPQLYDDFTLAKQATLLVAAALVLGGLAWEGEFLPRATLPRLLLVAWVLLLSVSLLASIDPRGSLLGYYQYRQGALTQFAYVVLFLGAVRAGREVALAKLLAASLAGLALVLGYTALQGLGADPVSWWTDTSARAIGTIGNANELAAYAVITIAFCGAFGPFGPRKAALGIGAVAAAAGFILIESESRSGLIASGVAAAAYPLCAAACAVNRREYLKAWGVLLGGVLVGAVLSAAAGGATGTAARVQSGLTPGDTSGSTRIELWKGTVATIAASPLLGAGPDGLFLAFPRHRPDGLGGAFKSYDLTVQSSHNAALDIAANEGLPALAVLIALLAVIATRSLKHERGRADAAGAPFVWAAMIGYLALTLVNPISLAPQALFVTLLGVMLGRSERALPAPAQLAWRAVAGRLAVAPAVASLILVAILLPIADWRADSGWRHLARGEFEQAARSYDSASTVMPIERAYASRTASSWLAAGVIEGAPALARAEAAYVAFDDDFGFSSSEAIGLATAQIGLGETAGLDSLLERALALNPEGVATEWYLHELRLAANTGGILRWAPADRWVFVVPREGATARPTR